MEGAVRGARNVLEEGMYLQINITISKFNIDEMDDLLVMADRLGAHVILLYTFVSIGRGSLYNKLALTPEEFAHVIKRAEEIQGEIEAYNKPRGCTVVLCSLGKEE